MSASGSHLYLPCIVVPFYNQPHYIIETVRLLQPYGLPVIVVDDGSDRHSKEVLQQMHQRFPETIVLQNPQNQGKGGAVITGFHEANRRGLTHILQVDADQQHNFADIDHFIELSKQNPEAVICGQPVYDSSVPKKRLYPRYITHVWVWINTLSLSIPDSMCGFRVYPVTPLMPIIQRRSISLRMGFDIELIVRVFWAGIPITHVKTEVIYHNDGSSTFRPWVDNLNISWVHTRLFFGMLLRSPSLILRAISRHKGRCK